MEKIANLWFDEGRVFVRTTAGEVYSRPVEAYCELRKATAEERGCFSIEDDGEAVRWPLLDLDMHIASFHETTEPDTDNEVYALFRRFPWLETSEVAKEMNISESLLDRYIHGIARPDGRRMAQLRATLHRIGSLLQTA